MARVDWTIDGWRIFEDSVKEFTKENAVLVHKGQINIDGPVSLVIQGEKGHGHLYAPSVTAKEMAFWLRR